jgi:hypothetical protein
MKAKQYETVAMHPISQLWIVAYRGTMEGAYEMQERIECAVVPFFGTLNPVAVYGFTISPGCGIQKFSPVAPPPAAPIKRQADRISWGHRRLAKPNGRERTPELQRRWRSSGGIVNRPSCFQCLLRRCTHE